MAAASDRSLCRVHYQRCCSDLTSGRPLPAARCTGCEAAKHELGPRTSDANAQDAQEHRQPQRAQVQTLSAAQSYEARRAQLGRHICHQSPGAHRHRCLQRRDAACEHAGRRKLNPSRNRNHVTLAASMCSPPGCHPSPDPKARREQQAQRKAEQSVSSEAEGGTCPKRGRYGRIVCNGASECVLRCADGPSPCCGAHHQNPAPERAKNRLEHKLDDVVISDLGGARTPPT